MMDLPLDNLPWQDIWDFIQAYYLKEFAITILLTVFLRYVFRFFKIKSQNLSDWIVLQKAKIPGFKIKRLEVISSEQVFGTISAFIKILTLLINILILLIYLNLILGLFEETKFLNQAVTKFFIHLIENGWKSFTTYLPNLISIFMIFVFAYYILKFSHVFFEAIQAGELKFKSFHKEWAKPTYQILKFIIIALVAVMVFPLLPWFNSPAFQGIGVFLGLLVSLGSTGIVSNVIAGIMIIYMRSFQLGDRVSVSNNNIMGDIIEQTLLVTKIRTIQNEEISIPNSILLSSPITNYSKESKKLGLILHTAITIGYDAPWRQVHELLINAAKTTTDILSEPEPHVFQKSLDDFYVSYEIRAYTDQPNKMAKIYSELHQNIQDQFNEAGVEIMSPHYRAHREGPLTIPDSSQAK